MERLAGRAADEVRVDYAELSTVVELVPSGHRLSFGCRGAAKPLRRAATAGFRPGRRSSHASDCRGNTSINNISIRSFIEVMAPFSAKDEEYSINRPSRAVSLRLLRSECKSGSYHGMSRDTGS